MSKKTIIVFSGDYDKVMAAFIIGWLIPKQVLYRLVKRYRQKLQDALPDTVDMLGIVLGTGLALDQAMNRVAEEMQPFAVWSSPALNAGWAEEMNARGILCIGCFPVPDPEPNVFVTTASDDQQAVQLTEYITKRLAGDPAIDFVVVSERAQLRELAQRVRDGRLRPHIGRVASLDDAVAALNPAERVAGKTVIRVRP